MFESYILIIIIVSILGLLLKRPILPGNPIRRSWKISVVFPMTIIAIYAIFDYFKFHHKIYTGTIIGIYHDYS